jgi:hypothetical protein
MLLKAIEHLHEDIPAEYADNAMTYFCHLSRSSVGFALPPSTCCDLIPGSPPGSIGQEIETIVHIHKNSARQTWYLLRSKHRQNNDVSFTLALSNPVSVCHIIRANISDSLYEVAGQLLVWEILFKTLERIPRNCTLPLTSTMLMFHNRVTLGMGV